MEDIKKVAKKDIREDIINVKEFDLLIETIGCHIIKWRKFHKKSQKKLSEISKIKLATIRKLEKGKGNPKVSTIHNLLYATDGNWDTAFDHYLDNIKFTKAKSLESVIVEKLGDLDFEDLKIVARMINYIALEKELPTIEEEYLLNSEIEDNIENECEAEDDEVDTVKLAMEANSTLKPT